MSSVIPESEVHFDSMSSYQCPNGAKKVGKTRGMQWGMHYGDATAQGTPLEDRVA